MEIGVPVATRTTVAPKLDVAAQAATVSLEQFRTLEGSTADGSTGKARLTNLMQLTVDTSWWTRYRSRTKNPDLDPTFEFAQAVPSLAVGQHPVFSVAHALLIWEYIHRGLAPHVMFSCFRIALDVAMLITLNRPVVRRAFRLSPVALHLRT